MKKRNTLITAVVVLVAVMAVPFVYAGPGGHRGDHGGRGGAFGFFGHIEKLKSELDLSDQQVDEIKTIFKATREQNAQYRDQLRGGLGDVASTLLANPNDLSKAQAIIDQQANAERAVKQNMLAAASKALNVLTPEQRAKLSQKLAERQEARSQRRGGRR